MKPSLQLRLGQQLTMTPQLQQAIRLLQLSTLDLQQEVQDALDNNPLLEQTEQSDVAEQPVNGEAQDLPQKAETASADSNDGFQDEHDAAAVETSEALNKEQISDELPVDSTWDDHLSAAPVSGASYGDDSEFSYQGETTDSLQSHLEWQMQLTPFSDVDRAIATAIIDAIDESGYLTVSAEDILTALGQDEEAVELDEVEAVIKRIQLFDPIGVGARSLQECLLVQVNQFAEDTPWLKECKQVLGNHIELLASRDYRQLMRKSKLKEDQLREVLRLIQSLNPRPGSAVISGEEQYVIPDVSVTKKSGRWVVELNPDAVPKLKVNQQYAAMSRTVKNSADSQYIRSHLQEAKWFIKSLESRNDTLMKVANCIVQFQRDFFEYGDEAMKPMVLNDIAQAVDMHESTISRVTTQKYMHTPRGIFELKYFFSSHVSTEGGGECSSTAIRALIKKLVAAEIPSKPLSDSKIADLLADQGIQVARRTIAKYRESLSIPPSNQRKSLL
ncbi:RNA polymerase factor sigma-54 [Corallincola platygyrae]|uniref:RNA polymerase sigma-54 factor n=1 Tax=Corallincola platygyrae TaxID=1193278 RepID=A0ABW4XQB6_9GAMM